MMSLKLYILVFCLLSCFIDAHWPKQPGAGAAYTAYPWAPEYNLARSTFATFLGNATGPNSAAETAAEARFGIIGLGWQLQMVPHNWSHLVETEITTARSLLALNPSARILVTREDEVAVGLYDEQAAIMHDPTKTSWWLQINGSVVVGEWGTPNAPPGGLKKQWYNFSTPAMTAWWLTSFVGVALSTPEFAGIYVDCSCGPPKGLKPGREYLAAADEALSAASKAAVVQGKWLTSWFSNAALPSPPNATNRYSPQSCASSVRDMAAQFGGSNYTLQLDYQPWKFKYTSGLPWIAAFLLVRGPYAVLEWPTGVYEYAVDMPWDPLLSTLDVGEPAGPMVEVVPNVFTRLWTKVNVSFDCNVFEGSVTSL